MVTYTQTRDGLGVMADDAFVPEDASNRDWQAYQVFLGAGGVALPAANLSLAAERAAAKLRINREAERRRASAALEVASAGFAAKLEEARKILELDAASQPITPADFPLVNVQLAVTAATTIEEAAQDVVDEATAARAEWAKVESARIQAHQAVDAAGTVFAIEAVQPAINWNADVPVTP